MNLAARAMAKLRMAKETPEAHKERSRKGGKRAAKNMTKKQRSERAKKAAQARWKVNDNDSAE